MATRKTKRMRRFIVERLLTETLKTAQGKCSFRLTLKGSVQRDNGLKIFSPIYLPHILSQEATDQCAPAKLESKLQVKVAEDPRKQRRKPRTA